MKSLQDKLIKLFWLVFSISMFLMLAAAITKPLNNLIPGRMVIFTLVWVVFYGVLWAGCCLLERKTAQLSKVMKCCVPIYLCIFGAALFVVSCMLRSDIITDYADVYNAALSFARGEEVTNWAYFSRWYNNIGAMLGLAVLFFLGGWLPETVDIYYFVLVLNVLQVVLVVYCLYYLVGRMVHGHQKAAQLMTLLVCGSWIPMWANTSIFYSDQLSFGAGVFGLTLLAKGLESRQKEGSTNEKSLSGKSLSAYIYPFLAGLCFGAGAILKVTSATIVIALAIGCLLFARLWKARKAVFTAIVTCIVCVLLFNTYCKTLPYQEDFDALKAPVSYWFAIGLGPNGTYGSSEEFGLRCLTAPTLEERKAIANEQIANNIHNLWNPEHIIAKARQNFGIGDLGAAGYLLYPQEENLLWHWFSMEGDYYWKYACLSTSFFFAVLFYLGVGGALQFVRLNQLKNNNKVSRTHDSSRQTVQDAGFFLSALAFWGLCLFLMLWEAQDKQLYNHSGWMILGLISSLCLLCERTKAKNHE